MQRIRTQIAIIGAGPAGLLLSHLLQRAGIHSVVLENHSRSHIEQRVRAGVLEHGSVELLRAAGVAGRLDTEGLVHGGIELRFDANGHRIPMTELTGRSITVYGQQEVVKDLIATRLDAGGDLRFDVDNVAVHGVAPDGAEPNALGTDSPRVTFTAADGTECELVCSAVAGCDGSHGVSRQVIPDSVLRTVERIYPYAWLGILARVPPSTDELIYARHPRGFAMHSLRSPELSRLYLEVPPNEELANWPDERIWSELHARLAAPGWQLHEGPIEERTIAPMRSFVADPMRYGRLFLAGDAAHIVPPTGAKGMNLALADVSVLAESFTAWLRDGTEEMLDSYSDRCLRRVWRAQAFSSWMTNMLHSKDDPFEAEVQLAQLRYTAGSSAQATALAQNYTGLPRDVW